MKLLRMLFEGVRVALDAIWANKLRAGLTILGVAVGVSVVVTMAALITGIRTSVMEGFEAAGPKNFVVTRIDFTSITLVNPGRPDWFDRPRIEPEEARRIGELPGVREALYNFGTGVTITYDGRRVRGVNVQAYSSGWPAYAQGEFIAGRDFTPTEVQRSRSVTVLSTALAEELFGQRDPIGRRVSMSSSWRNVREEFRVIGVFEPDENIFSDAVEHWAVLPHTTAAKRLKASTWQAQILVVPEDSVSQAEAQDQVTGLLRGFRGLGPREDNDFTLLRSDQVMELFNQFTAAIFLVMLALSSVGLMVGGVGVIGIMLISVTERTREIGIRKAVGATRREILWQFLVEAGVLTVLGGAAGMAIGAVGAELVESFSPLPATIPLWSVVAALGMAAVTGMLFGLLPAYQAAHLEPVDALRHE